MRQLLLNRDQALNALSRYNRAEVLALDAKAARKFSTGLGKSLDDLEDQVAFVFHEYGGLPLPRTVGLAQRVASEIHAARPMWEALLRDAPSFDLFAETNWSFARPAERHLECFGEIRQLGHSAQLRCMTKFLHLLKPDAFVIADRWIGAAIDANLACDDGAEGYRHFVQLYLRFIVRHRSLLLDMALMEQSRSWSHLKLVDKIILCRRSCGEQKLAA